jgi:hypothetical protein
VRDSGGFALGRFYLAVGAWAELCKTEFASWPRADYFAAALLAMVALEHRAKKWVTLFSRQTMLNQNIEHDA